MSVLGGLLRGLRKQGDLACVTQALVDEAKRRLAAGDGVRMFRPATPRGWAPVIARVADELRTAAARGGGPSLPSSS